MATSHIRRVPVLLCNQLGRLPVCSVQQAPLRRLTKPLIFKLNSMADSLRFNSIHRYSSTLLCKYSVVLALPQALKSPSIPGHDVSTSSRLVLRCRISSVDPVSTRCRPARNPSILENMLPDKFVRISWIICHCQSIFFQLVLRLLQSAPGVRCVAEHGS